MAGERIAIVTGANKGIGFAVCRRLAREGARVVLTARDTARGEAAREELAQQGLPVLFRVLDVTVEESVRAAAAFVERELGRLDILVNNAAVQLDRCSAEDLPIGVMREMIAVNVYGPLRVCRVFLPLLRRSSHPRIVNVSSRMGSLAEMGGGSCAYRVTKTALNAVTCLLADELRGRGALVNAAHPGWVRTDMGGRGAPKSADEGADTPVWLALLPDGGPTGGFFADRRPVPW